MSRKRNEFMPQNMLTVYSSPSGMTDPRTQLPYYAGGLLVGDYFELTEAEAQALSNNQLHEGQYRFVQIDSTATAANIVQGSIGFMKTLSLGVNFITSADKALSINIRPVVFLAPLSSAQVLAGAYVFVQEAGDAFVTAKTSLTNGSPAVGDIINGTANGLVDDPTTQNVTGSTIGIATQLPTGGGQFRLMLDLPPMAG